LFLSSSISVAYNLSLATTKHIDNLK